MRTRSGKVYHPDKPNIDIDPNASLSSITSPTEYLTLKILKTLQEIKVQINNLDQRMDMLEVEHRDGGRNEERQFNQRWEGRSNRNYDRYNDDERYQKNIKLDISNFDDRLDP